jgi:hypothetical protein
MSYRPIFESIIIHALDFLSSFKYAEKLSIEFSIFFHLKKTRSIKMQKNFVSKETKKLLQNEKGKFEFCFTRKFIFFSFEEFFNY